MIVAEGLRKTFGKVVAVDALSFAARDGCITGLLGPNGAGKSTALRILCGILRADAGRASIDGQDVQGEALAARAACGVLPHNAGIYERLTARENIRYYGRLNRMSGAQLEQRIDELGEMLEMGDFMERRARGFSQGQRTKVALARALVHSPRNVILDEPTNGLDVMATRALRGVIDDLRRRGHCVLFSSHIMQEVAALCDEMVIMGRGCAVASGSPDAIRAQTGEDDLENAFVAALGSAEGLA